MALLMLLDKHLGAYLYTMRLKMLKRSSAHIDQFPYRHQKGYLGVTYQNYDTFIRLVGEQLKVTCDSIRFCKSVLKCVLT